jgi:hypothetical protein
MMIRNGNGTYTAGPLDVIVILHDVSRGSYHVCFFEEYPMPGPVRDIETDQVVRLKSKMHHTTGSRGFEGAQRQLDEMRSQIELPDSNVVRDQAYPWNGEPGIVWLTSNWRSRQQVFGDVFSAREPASAAGGAA